ncbi:MAG: hypothetical protein ACTSRS_01495 [Candidatus Helarchaeota archaeon]
MNEPTNQINPPQEEKTSKKKIATVITLGIVFGFLIILFAITIILINLIPVADKWNWLITEASIANWILLIGVGLLEFFFALTMSVYIWKKGRNYLLKHI